jgi:MFS family permease
MPDVTPKPVRSQGNAVINLCGGIGGALAFLIYTVVLFGERLENYVIIFCSVAGGMLLLLAGLLAFVKEKKMVAKCREICKEYGIDADEDVKDELSSPTPAIDGTTVAEEVLGEQREVEAFASKSQSEPVAEPTLKNGIKAWWASKTKAQQGELISFWLILASIFMWFMGYNAISSNLSIYITKELNLSAGVASIVSGVSMGISAIAFIPVGFLAAKIGRKKSVMIGFALAIVSFILVLSFVKADANALIPTVLFCLFYLISGFGLIIANVNTLPMVVELSTEKTVGKYTGYYYVATMSAQAITPTFGGLIMDTIGNRYIFLYSAICIAAAIVLMLFVRHGDIQISKGKLSKEEKKQIMLDAIDN